MRKINREKKKVILTKEDIKKGLKDSSIDSFDKMLNTDLYSFRIKQYLYSDKKISARGFLFNDDIYNLPLGKKDRKGNILIDDGIIKIFDRFLLAQTFVEDDDVLVGFLVDSSDLLYETICKIADKGEEVVTESDYVSVLNVAMSEIFDIITVQEIENFIFKDTELTKLANKKIDDAK